MSTEDVQVPLSPKGSNNKKTKGSVNFFSGLIDPGKKNRKLLSDLNTKDANSKNFYYFACKLMNGPDSKNKKLAKKILRFTETGITFINNPEKFDSNEVSISLQSAKSYPWKEIPSFKFLIPLEEFRFIWEDPSFKGFPNKPPTSNNNSNSSSNSNNNGQDEKPPTSPKSSSPRQALPPSCTLYRFSTPQLEELRTSVQEIMKAKQRRGSIMPPEFTTKPQQKREMKPIKVTSSPNNTTNNNNDSTTTTKKSPKSPKSPKSSKAKTPREQEKKKKKKFL